MEESNNVILSFLAIACYDTAKNIKTENDPPVRQKCWFEKIDNRKKQTEEEKKNLERKIVNSREKCSKKLIAWKD